jgi:ubiquinone/menaquinone biosynthesis C-methylase UbiE
MNLNSFDSVWETRYKDNPKYRNHYPWSAVVSFVYINRPVKKEAKDIKILEVGCGNGNNLWFAAREGFSVAGIDGSETAIAYAKDWFGREGLAGDFRVGDFTNLPFEDSYFDIVIDRSALTLCGMPAINNAIAEIWRVLCPEGKFLFNPMSDRSSSFDGLPDQDGCYRKVRFGPILPGAQIKFYSILEIRELFQKKWIVNKIMHNEQMSFHAPERTVYADWQVELMKISNTYE